MDSHETQLTSKQRKITNSLRAHIKATQGSVKAAMNRVENLDGAHAEIAYRLLLMAYDAIGNIGEPDLVEIAKVNAQPGEPMPRCPNVEKKTSQ